VELPYSQDMLDLLATFNRWQVQYLIVGGRAVNAYTEARGTKDLDIWTNPTPENAKRVYAALKEFGAPLFGATEETFAHKGDFLFIGVPPNRIDILKEIPGVEFDACWEKRECFDLGGGLSANYLGLPELIAAKLTAGRHIDLADAEKLTVALERRRKQTGEREGKAQEELTEKKTPEPTKKPRRRLKKGM
jgi:hypothetical protein